MVKLDFLGKGQIANLHLTAPYRSLDVDKKLSVGDGSLDGNLIIQGDNLHALKALLPHYEGRINCIYIDPPYNTGNEGWIYNDKVNSPLHKEWLGKEVGVDDQCRHDKWMCMMWPRLQLLKDLLAEDGVIFISIDDHEQHRLRGVMDELFGEDNFVNNIIWQKKYSPQNDARHFSDNHDFILCYAKDKAIWRPILLPRTAQQDKRYSNPDNDPRGVWKTSGLDVKTYQEEYDYPITVPSGRVVRPPKGRCWAHSKERFLELVKENRIWFGKDGNNVPSVKRFLLDVKKGVTPMTVWLHSEVGHSQSGTQGLKQIGIEFSNPKPASLLKKVFHIGAGKDAIILDSFAGSGTTAQAVLALNREDGGNRKFILVECEEEIAPKITAERVRRVMKGVNGAKDENLRGGLGGSFTYCTLGEAIEEEKILSGESMPSWETLARYVFYLATGETLKHTPKQNKKGFVGKTEDLRIYLIYKDDLEFMRSNGCALTLDCAEALLEDRQPGEKLIVYAAAAYLSHSDLKKRHIQFCQLPYALEHKLHD